MQVKSITESAILLTFIKLPFVIKIFALSIFSGRLSQVLLYMYGKVLSTLNCSATVDGCSKLNTGLSDNTRHHFHPVLLHSSCQLTGNNKQQVLLVLLIGQERASTFNTLAL